MTSPFYLLEVLKGRMGSQVEMINYNEPPHFYVGVVVRQCGKKENGK